MAERAHGTHAKYALDRCRCDRCREAQRFYNRNRVRQMSRPDGVWRPYVDASRAREHVCWLASCGIGLKSVAKISGVAHGTLSKLVYGDPARRMAPSRRIRPATETRILATLPAAATGAQRVPAAPTWRLLEELIGRGWSRSELARRLGSETPALQISHRFVKASTARRVEQLHAELIGIAVIPKRTRWGVQPTPAGKPYRRDSLKPRRVYEKVPRPFPLAPLAMAAGMTEAETCRLLGWNLSRVRAGLSEAQADRAALWLGLHPIQIWGEAWAS